MSLYCTIHENSRRFVRSVFMHLLTFSFILLGHFLLNENNGTVLGRSIFSLSILILAYTIFNILAPLPLGYKARKVMKAVKKTHYKD